MNALRRRPSGATVAKLADVAGMSERHTRRCLRELADLGFCEQASESVVDGHVAAVVPVWKMSYSSRCFEMLDAMPTLATRPLPSDESDSIPPRFWAQFWSGPTGRELRLSEHGLHIAGMLIGGRDIAAECWALRRTPTADLRELRAMRGYDEGVSARALDAELARRAHAV